MAKKYNSVALEAMLFDSAKEDRSGTLEQFECWLEERLHTLNPTSQTDAFLRTSDVLSELRDYRFRYLHGEVSNGQV